MNEKLDLSIVIPCFNEIDGIEHLVLELKKLEKKLNVSHEFIFVDDGSSDETYVKLVNVYQDRIGKDIKVLKHEKNEGLGTAVKTGILKAEGRYVATMDSDCTYKPTYLVEMFDIMKQENADIITASPYHPEGQTQNVPGYRLFLSRTLSNMYNVVCKGKFYTYTSMFRIYKNDSIKKITFESKGFLAMSEILVKGHKKGLKIIEFPATLTGRKFGISSAKTFSLIKSHIGFIIEILLKRY